MDFRGDPSVLPPEQRCREIARRISDPEAARGYLAMAKSMTASHAQLVIWARDGLAYELGDGTIVAGVTKPQVNAAVTSAQAAAMTPSGGGPCNDPGFRRWLEERCQVIGLPAPEWSSVDSQGYAGAHPGSLSGGPYARPGAPQAAGARARRDPPLPSGRPAAIAPYDGRSATAGKGLMTDVRIPVGSTITTPVGARYTVTADPAALADRGEAFAKAAQYEQYAGDLSLDPALRDGYRQLAAKARREESRA